MNELLNLKVEICHLDLKENTISNLLTTANKVQEEIEKLNSGFDKLENWLNNEIDRIEKMINPKTGIKPYGEELTCLRIIKNSYIYTKDKLKELKGSDE